MQDIGYVPSDERMREDNADAPTDYSHDEKGKRIDVHRPSAIVISDYELAAPLPGLPWWKSGPFMDYGAVVGTCNHCGHAIRYAVRFVYKPTGAIVTFGEDCTDLIDLPEKSRYSYEFQRLRTRAANERKQLAWEEQFRLRREEMTREHPDLVEYFEDFNPEQEDSWAIKGMFWGYEKYGSLLDGQVTKMREILKKRDEYIQARLAEPIPTQPLAEGKRVIEGVVKSVKWKNSDFGGAWKIVVMEDDGNKVWGTAAAALLANHDSDTLKGQRVKFTATVKVSDTDDHFGFFSKPSKAEVA